MTIEKYKKLLLIMILIAPIKISLAYELYVSPDGSDANEGTISSPLVSLEMAQKRIRQSRSEHQIDHNEEVNIYLREGTYPLEKTFILNENDSGSQKSPIKYTAYNNENVRLIGAVKIAHTCLSNKKHKLLQASINQTYLNKIKIVDLTNCSNINTTKFIWDKPIPQLIRSTEKSGPQEIFSDGIPMIPARWPNHDWAYTGKVLNKNKFQINGKKRIELWNDSDTWLRGYWKWDWFDEAIPLELADPSRHEITLSKNHYYGLEKGKRFYVFNSLSELDEKGEYYIDTSTNTLFLWPYKDNRDLYISNLKDPIITFEDASNIIFKGITFEMGRGVGININGGSNIRIVDSVIRNLGNTGIIINGGVNHNISNNELYNLGTRGIVVIGGDRASLTPAKHKVDHNNIHHYGRRIATIHAGIDIDGVGINISHNMIHHAPHMGIRFAGNEHLIEMNDVHDVCLETSDAGAIYSGRDWASRGNKLFNNKIYNVLGLNGKGDVSAIYLDDFSSGTIIKNNIISNVKRGILIGGGRDNIINENIIYKVRIPFSIDSRGVGWAKASLKKGSQLWNALFKMPYKSIAWRSKYPRLTNILEDNPGLPKGNVFSNNVVAESGNADIFLVETEMDLSGNVIKKELDFVGPENGNYSLINNPSVEVFSSSWFKHIYQKSQ